MAKLIAYCGLDCSGCPAYMATQESDQEGLEKTAAEWSKQFGMEMKPEEIICDGCATPSERKTSYCSTCEIRVCCIEKGKENCGSCEEYMCAKLDQFLKQAPEAKEGLEEIRERNKA